MVLNSTPTKELVEEAYYIVKTTFGLDHTTTHPELIGQLVVASAILRLTDVIKQNG